jgi:inner membrane protein
VCAFSGKIHWQFAFLVWLLIQIQIPEWINPLPFLLGSIFPDADIRKSMIGKIIPLWLFFKHRQFVHSLQAAVLFSLPVVCIYWKWGILFFIGFLFHLMMDSGTPSGIRWIYRRRKRAYR